MRRRCGAQHLNAASPHRQLWCLSQGPGRVLHGLCSTGPGALAPLQRGWQRWARWARAGAAVRCVCRRAQCRARVLQRRALPGVVPVSWPEFKAPEAAASPGYKASSSGVQHGRPSPWEPSAQQTCAQVAEVPGCPSQSVDDAAPRQGPPQGPPSPHGGTGATELMPWAVAVLNRSGW